MNKTNLLLAVGLACLSVPASATHPNELCHIAFDVAALAKSVGADPASVRITYVFGGGISNMTDMSPLKPEIVSRPSEGPWTYTADIHSNLYYRVLKAVRIESVLFKPEDGTPVWRVVVERPSADDQKKGAPIRCENYAD